ncbi:hypothetical protein [Roseimicrobium gellanilyticum]|nr:hypothetical protein [Roseimicrobium gellanilyticum]
MPRWLKILLCTALLLGVLGLVSYHVLEWWAEDSLVVRHAGIEQEPDGRVFINFEFHNRSRFPLRVVDVSTLYAADDYSFAIIPPQLKESFLLKAGAQHHYQVHLQDPELPMLSREGILTADWTPASATWLAPVFDGLRRFYFRVHPAGVDPMPRIKRTMNQDFVIRKDAQGNPEAVEMGELPNEWRFAFDRWKRER